MHRYAVTFKKGEIEWVVIFSFEGDPRDGAMEHAEALAKAGGTKFTRKQILRVEGVDERENRLRQERVDADPEHTTRVVIPT